MEQLRSCSRDCHLLETRSPPSSPSPASVPHLCPHAALFIGRGGRALRSPDAPRLWPRELIYCAWIEAAAGAPARVPHVALHPHLHRKRWRRASRATTPSRPTSSDPLHETIFLPVSRLHFTWERCQRRVLGEI